MCTLRRTFVPFALFVAFAPLCALAQTVPARVGVLDFQATGISLAEAQLIGDLFTSELVASRSYDVVDRKNIEKLLGEQELQASDCTDSSCALRIGQLLAVEYMIYGSVGKLGESHVMSAQLLDVGTGRIEASASGKFARIDDAYDAVPKVVAELVGKPEPLEQRTTRGGTRKPRALFFDLGGGFAITNFEAGVEIDLGLRYAMDWHIPIGVGLGALVGLSFSNVRPVGVRFGIDGYLYAKPFPRFAFSLGFRGSPVYIGYGAGLTVGVHFDNLFVRAHLPIIYSYGFGLDVGYTF